MPNVNPFLEKGTPINKSFESLKKLYPKAYDKKTTSPYTKVRVILMNGTEFEANWFSHQFSRHCTNEDLRREIAIIRRREQQQQKKSCKARKVMFFKKDLCSFHYPIISITVLFSDQVYSVVK